MPEGPSIVILRELAEGFAGKRVREATGSTGTIDPARMQGLAVRRVASWGKHFLLQFDGFALRVHFMLYGSYAIDGGKPGRAPRLHLGFARGRSLDFYACSLRYVEGDIDDRSTSGPKRERYSVRVTGFRLPSALRVWTVTDTGVIGSLTAS